MTAPHWWIPPWEPGGATDPDIASTTAPATRPGAWHETADFEPIDDSAILEPLEAQFEQVRSRDRVRDLAEVFTHQREVDAILDMVADAFVALDVKFLEPACGSGNFLTEILRRKLGLVSKHDCASQDQYEHRLLRALGSIYGIDISPQNVTEARARLAHGVLQHYQADANTIEPTTGFLNAAALMIGDNIVVGDTLNSAHTIELCDWQPHPGSRFRRVWSFALVPEADRDLFWTERVQDVEPVHFSELKQDPPVTKPTRRKTKAT